MVRPFPKEGGHIFPLVDPLQVLPGYYRPPGLPAVYTGLALQAEKALGRGHIKDRPGIGRRGFAGAGDEALAEKFQDPPRPGR
ncbi:hypothetical protein FACS189468_6470 [Spirochaetia bacterium]|nr:hypothetical protein FACS189468_6470 [Spirochaetia bacterium]